MNVLFISNDPSIFLEESSARLRMREYAEAVSKIGGTLHVLSAGNVTENFVEGSLHLYARQATRVMRVFVLTSQAKKILRNTQIDVVSCQDPFEHGLIGLLAVRNTSSKLHIQVHTDFLSPWFTQDSIYRSPRVRMPRLNKVRVRLADYTLVRASGIRTVSHRVKESLMKKYGTTIVEPSVIPIFVSQVLCLPVPLPPDSRTFTLLVASRLEPEKRIQDILAAVARIHVQYPSLALLIAGSGSERKNLENMANKLGIEDRVIFLGHRNDVRGLMQNAHSFIQTSAYEGYGITLIEAALAGCPIITSDVGIVGEVFVGYEDVLAAPVGDPINFAAHTAWLIEDQFARKDLAKNAKAKVLAHLHSIKNKPSDIIADIQKTIIV